jgi:hypothetical protein
MSFTNRQKWIDSACDKLKEEKGKCDMYDLERRNNLTDLIDTGAFLSAIFCEMTKKYEKLRPDAVARAEELYREFRSIFIDMGLNDYE